tara:strand:+ start:6935 stop:7630 length:696 start_codon:yes stop_codon:yes gene_type:complete
MKKFIYIIILGTLLWSCGGSGGDNPPVVIENKAPSTPTLIYPSSNLLCIENSISFKWNASTDPDAGDTVTYQIQIAKDNSFTQIVESISNTSTTRDITLEKGVAYYWRVSAKDTKNNTSSYSIVNSFYTEGNGVSNYLPFSAEIVSPNLNAVVQTNSTTLTWNASDVDNDPLSFDVYFGTDNPPATKTASNLTNKSLAVNLTSATTYYWKIIVKDDKGGETIGQVWNFKTD